MPKNPRPPAYRFHKARNSAVVTINGKNFYLGHYGSPESKEKYARLIAEHAVNPVAAVAPEPAKQATLADLALIYLDHVRSHYLDSKGREYGCTKVALQIVVDLYGSTPAAEFGPLALQAVRDRMIRQPKGGARAKPDDTDKAAVECWSRSYVNASVARVKRMFKWAVARELAPVEVHQALACVPGLRRGKSKARETMAVAPVPQAVIDATLPHLPPVVADMVRLQLLTGCRPGELCILRPADLDRSRSTWCYVPGTHKTQYRGDQRRIYFGPQAKAILAPYLLRAADVYCFSPAESEAKRHAEQRDARKSPVQPSQQARRKAKPKWAALGQYDVHAYRRAIARACKRANVKPWHPHQLRHATATTLREKFGIEASQVVLGHSDANITLVYAEKNFALAEKIMAEVG